MLLFRVAHAREKPARQSTGLDQEIIQQPAEEGNAHRPVIRAGYYTHLYLLCKRTVWHAKECKGLSWTWLWWSKALHLPHITLIIDCQSLSSEHTVCVFHCYFKNNSRIQKKVFFPFVLFLNLIPYLQKMGGSAGKLSRVKFQVSLFLI